MVEEGTGRRESPGRPMADTIADKFRRSGTLVNCVQNDNLQITVIRYYNNVRSSRMARAKQSKYIVLSNLCEICVAPTKFELVGDAVGQEEGKRWAKCAKCHHTMMIDMMVIEGERRAAKETNVSVEDCIPYSPKAIYTIG